MLQLAGDSADAMQLLLKIATAQDLPLIHNLIPPDRQWLESELTKGTNSQLLLAAIRLK